MIGTRVGGWLVTEEIGDGGHAFVFKGVAGNEVVAVKMLKPSVAGEDNLETRFKIEAETLKSLNHPSIVGFRDYIYANGFHYLILEYMDAGSVEGLIDDAPLDARYAIPIFSKVLDGIIYAHQYGFIHRDIKPNNILLNQEGDVKLTDFGIAKVVGGEKITRKGFVVGTPEYMAPEYLSQGVVSPQSDVYSLGVTMYQVLTRRKPFEHDTGKESAIDFVKKVCMSEPPPPSMFCPVPAPLEKIVMKAIARDVKKRYREMDRLKADLAKAYPQLVEKPIEIPQGKPRTRMLQMQSIGTGTPREQTSGGRPPKPIRPSLVFAYALVAGLIVGGTAAILSWGPLLSASMAVLAAGLVVGIAFLLARRNAASAPEPTRRAPRPAVPEARVSELPPGSTVDDESEVPFHAGGNHRVVEETHLSELKAYLEVTAGEQAGKRWGLRPVSRIGRDLRFDIRPYDKEVSRQHAAVTFDGSGFVVRDIGSTNGTFVNEEKVIGEVPLLPGGILRVGRCSMRLVQE